MIPTIQAPEYPNFDADVRSPGRAFLRVCPTPTSKEFRKKSFWVRALRDLHAAYSGICAYTSVYLPDYGSVDHFLPKSTHPDLAYEWSNFRLARGRVNNAKDNKLGLVDPFEVKDNWFFLDLPSCLLKPNPNLDRVLRVKIKGTIDSLKLNSDDVYVEERSAILVDFARGDCNFMFLKRRYPFLYKEIVRQGLDQPTLRHMFRC